MTSGQAVPSDSIVIRPVVASDVGWLTEMNNAAVPAVSVADAHRMAELVEMSAVAWAVQRVSDAQRDSDVQGGDEPLAFVLLFDPGSTYESKNYAWFSERFERFLYVDRIVVAAQARGVGIGELLYDAVIAEAVARGSERVAAEVNVDPPNPGSSKFHRRKGFEPVAEVELGPGYIVEMLVCPVSEDGAGATG